MERRFFKLFDHNAFSELGIAEQKKELIDKGVYIQGQSHFEKDETPKHFYGNGYLPFIGEDFTFEESTYTLNPDFLNEVFNLNLDYFKENNQKNIDQYVQSLMFQIEFSGDFSQILKNAEEDYKNALGYRIFQELHINRDKESSIMENTVKKHFSYDFYALSQYILGLENFANSYVFTKYHTFLCSTAIIELCNSYRSETIVEGTTTDKKFSMPKFVAMLDELNFFNSEAIKNLTLYQKSRTVLALMQKDHNNKNSIHSVEKNIQALNPKSKLDNKKFTSWSHIEEVRKIIQETKTSSARNNASEK